MADCFISYRRTPSGPVATTIQAKLENEYGFNVYVDTTRTDSTRVQFPDRLMQAIEEAPVFVCLLGERDGEHTLQSEWVLKEIQRAYELQKFCVPVFQESYRPLPDMPPAVEYLLNFDGVHYFDQQNVMIDDSVRKLAALLRPYRKRRTSRVRLLGCSLLVILTVMIGALVAASGLLLVDLDIPTPTLSDFERLGTAEAAITRTIDIQTELAFAAITAQVRNNDATQTAAVVVATEVAAHETLIALSVTPTDTPSNTPTATLGYTSSLSPLELLELARTPVASNAAWQPSITERDFSGIPMVLVPAGCFMMGSDNGYDDERPVHEQCFDEPFWIGKYEVTNAQFGSADCESNPGPDQPRNCVIWLDAQIFCKTRDARLPTEAEWEYAARGPDSLIYPWGNEFVGANVIYGGPEYGNAKTAPVGSRPGGASWVGALDMSGNVWEWTSSLYEDYPYDAMDGRERDTGDSMDVQRVMRGGSFVSVDSDSLRAAVRAGYDLIPVVWNDAFVGFRCARDYEP